MQTIHKASVGRACRVISLRRSLYYHQSPKDDTEIALKLPQYAQIYLTYDFDGYPGKIHHEGLIGNRRKGTTCVQKPSAETEQME